jgi:predicted nuclease of predicted toxin-antitoxin system
LSRVLLDENVSPGVATILRAHGHDAVHVNDVTLQGRPDAVIMLWAADAQRTVVTHDHDFGDNLATLRAGAPSVITISQKARDGIVGTADQAAHLARALPRLEQRLARGSLVALDRHGYKVTPLPLTRTRGRGL